MSRQYSFLTIYPFHIQFGFSLCVVNSLLVMEISIIDKFQAIRNNQHVTAIEFAKKAQQLVNEHQIMV